MNQTINVFRALAIILVCHMIIEIVAAGTCGVSAPPNITLNELHHGCSTPAKSRHPECVAAMHRFCGRVTYASVMTTLGVSREVGIDRIGMSCIRSQWSGLVLVTTLQRYHAGCSAGNSQHFNCLSAIHRFCSATLGSNQFAGTSQEVPPNNVLYVKCFHTPRKEHVSHAVLQAHHSGCTFPNSHSDFCYSAASRWCVSEGYSGGITQEVNTIGVTVACYSAEFSNDVFVTRSSDFYAAAYRVAHICSLEFDITNGTVSSQRLFLKTEMYDNRASSVVLHSNFQVSKEITESSLFNHDDSYTIGNKVLPVSARFPVFDGTNINLSTSATATFIFTGQTMQTKSYTAQSSVEVPGGKGIVKEATVQQATLDIPWSAGIINDLGVATTIHGQWRGVDTYNLQVTQKSINEFCSCA